MGDILCGDLIMKTIDGKEIHIENAVINEISANAEEIEICNPKDDFFSKKVTNYNYEVSLTAGKIKKKRFIKLLMARGIARNGAEDIASYVHKKYGHYNQMFLLLI